MLARVHRNEDWVYDRTGGKEWKRKRMRGVRESWLSRWYFQFHRAWVNEARGLEKLGRPSLWNILRPRQKWALWSQCYTSSPCALSVIRSASFWWRTPLNVVPYRALTRFRYITFADYRPASRSMSPSHPRDTYLLQSSHPFLWLASAYLRDVGVGGNVRDERNDRLALVFLSWDLNDFSISQCLVCLFRPNSVSSRVY